MFSERDRREQLRNPRGRRLKKGACSRRIELCSPTSRVSCLNQRYCFLLVLSIVPRYPKTFLPSTEVYISARNFSNHRNLQRSKVTCISESLLALCLYAVTNATKNIEFPTCIDRRVEKGLLSKECN
jgi:hypothetical protein